MTQGETISVGYGVACMDGIGDLPVMKTCRSRLSRLMTRWNIGVEAVRERWGCDKKHWMS